MTLSIPLPGEFGDSQAVLEEARGRQRQRRNRRLGASLLLIAAAGLAVGLFLASPSSPSGNSSSGGGALSSARAEQLVAAPNAHLLDAQVRFPYIPKGFALVNASRINSGSEPYEYQDTIEFSTAATAGLSGALRAKRLDVTVLQADTTSFDRANELSCSPASTCPPFHLKIDGVLATGNSVVRGLGTTVIYWTAEPHIHLAVNGQGVSASVVARFAESLVYSSTSPSCLIDGKAQHNGICAPDLIESSPPETLSSSQATNVGAGSVHGHTWTLYGAVSSDSRQSWVEIEYGGAIATLNDSPPMIDSLLTNAHNGTAFLIGTVPQDVTHIELGVGNEAMSITPVSTVIAGWRFFAVPAPPSLTKNCVALSKTFRTGNHPTPGPYRRSPREIVALEKLQVSTQLALYHGSTKLPQLLAACNAGATFTSTKS